MTKRVILLQAVKVQVDLDGWVVKNLVNQLATLKVEDSWKGTCGHSHSMKLASLDIFALFILGWKELSL